MDQQTKHQLKAQIAALRGLNGSFKSMMGTPPPPVIGGMPPMPIHLQPSLAPYLAALKMHADNYDQLLKTLSELIEKS